MDRIFTACGPVQAESLLIEHVLADVRKSVAQPNSAKSPGVPGNSALSKPLLIVVPSSELRLNLIVSLAEAGATLGVEVQTLHSLALNLHRCAGNDTTSRSMLSEVLARRATLQQPGLRSTFQPLADGLGVVSSSIRDLLTAGHGFESFEFDAQLSNQTRELLKAATATRKEMLNRGCRRPGDLQAEAASLVEAHLHARAVWIYGFADVTAQSKQLIQSLYQAGAKLLVDLPPDPAFADNSRVTQFARRFISKVSGEELKATEVEQFDCKRQFFHSSGRSDEVREVAHRILDLLTEQNSRSSGHQAASFKVLPEKIGVVVRNFDAYAAEFRYWFEQLGIPFRSAPAPAGYFPDHRRMQAAIEVLQRGGSTSVDRWLDALSRSLRRGALASRLEDFRIAMRTLGVTRLQQASELDAGQLAGERGVYRLPVRTRADDSAPSGDSAPRSKNRALTVAQLAADIGLLQQTLDRIKNWPRKASLAEHAEYSRLAFEKDFAWKAGANSLGASWQDLLDGVVQLDTKRSDYAADEFMVLLGKAAKDFGVPPSSPAGGGVAVLDFTQARARTFDHLFVLGLNRGVVPRLISEDPALPDRQRALLQTPLPDLQQKLNAHEEERYLFAQLCSASPKLTLSWLRADDDGKELAPSPFLQRIWLADRPGEAEDLVHAVPRLRAKLFENKKQPLISAEAEQYFALLGQRENWQNVLQTKAADARHRVLNEVEPDFAQPDQRKARDSIGPYMGWLGKREVPPSKVFVTRLENIAGCPWRALLTSRLRLEPIADPILDLPSNNALMLGNVVHDAMERLTQNGSVVRRPKPKAIRDALATSALKVALQEEIRLDGMINALTAQAEPFLQKAIDLEWPNSDSILNVVGCEVTEQTHVSWDGFEFDLHFRADRVDRDEGDGEGDGDADRECVIYTDYKTSKPKSISTAKGDATRREHHLNKVRSGSKLQGAAYACSKSGAVGRYLFLNLPDDAGLDQAEFLVSSNDEEFSTTFSQTSAALYQSLLLGVAPPRMEILGKKKDNSVCGYCDVSDACLLKDSGNRRRLVEGIGELADRRSRNLKKESESSDCEAPLTEAELNLTDLWYLSEGHKPWQDGEEQS